MTARFTVADPKELSEWLQALTADKRCPAHEPLVEPKGVARYLGVKKTWVKDRVRNRVPKGRQIPHYKLGQGKGTYLRLRIWLVDNWLEMRRQGFGGPTR